MPVGDSLIRLLIVSRATQRHKECGKNGTFLHTQLHISSETADSSLYYSRLIYAIPLPKSGARKSRHIIYLDNTT